MFDELSDPQIIDSLTEVSQCAIPGTPTPYEAREVLRLLERGVPPPASLIRLLSPFTSVECTNLLNLCHPSLRNGTSAVALVADPGGGKSHTLCVLEAKALDANFIVSRMSLDLASRVMPNRPDLFVRAIFARITTPASTGGMEPLHFIVDKWAISALETSADKIQDMRYLAGVCDAGWLPQPFRELDSRSRLSLLLYLVGRRENNEELMRFSISAFADRQIENRALMRAAEENALVFHQFRLSFTPSPYDLTHQLGKLSLLAWIIASLGYSGFAVLVDEVASISNLGTVSRRKAYETMASLFRACNGPTFVFAVMPAFLRTLRKDKHNGVEGASGLLKLIESSNVELSETSEVEKAAIAVCINRLGAIAYAREDQPLAAILEAASLLLEDHPWKTRDWVRHWVKRCTSLD